MPKLGKTSKERLATCHIALQEIVERSVEIMDLTVLCGFRDREAQEEAYSSGASKARFGQSLHNASPSLAVDIAPYPVRWDDLERFVLLAGVLKAVSHDLGYSQILRWGGDWDRDDHMLDENFRDYVHFEIKES